MVDEKVKDELILKAAELEIEKIKMDIEHKRSGEQRRIEAHEKYLWEVEDRAADRAKNRIKDDRWLKHLDDSDASCKDQRNQLRRLADTLDQIANMMSQR